MTKHSRSGEFGIIATRREQPADANIEAALAAVGWVLLEGAQRHLAAAHPRGVADGSDGGYYRLSRYAYEPRSE